MYCMERRQSEITNNAAIVATDEPSENTELCYLGDSPAPNAKFLLGTPPHGLFNSITTSVINSNRSHAPPKIKAPQLCLYR
jgi:hypothetical protein